MNVKEYVDNFLAALDDREKKLKNDEDYKDATDQKIREDAYYYFGFEDDGEDIEDLGKAKALELLIGRLLFEANSNPQEALKEYVEGLSNDNIENCSNEEIEIYNILTNLANKEIVAENDLEEI